MIYLIMLLFVILYSNIFFKKSNGKKLLFSLIVLAFILSIFAGIRSVDLGYDAKMYVSSTFLKLDFYHGTIEFLENTNIEIGFGVLSLILYNILPDINFLLFGYNLITNIIFVYSFYILRDEIKINKIMPFYYCTLYLLSFNIMRQSISLGFIFLAYAFLIKNKSKVKTLLLILIGFFFHNSAFLAIPLFIVHILLKKNSKNFGFIFFGTIIIFMMFSILFEDIFILLNRIGIISEKYIFYVLNAREKIDFNFVDTVFKIFLVIVSVLCMKKYKNLSSREMLIYSVLSLLINILAFRVLPLSRISMYYFYPVLFINITKKYDLTYNSKNLSHFVNFLMTFMYFMWKVILGNSYLIFPFKTFF